MVRLNPARCTAWNHLINTSPWAWAMHGRPPSPGAIFLTLGALLSRHCTLTLSLSGGCPQVTGLAVSDRHPYMFSCSLDKEVKCWDMEYNKASTCRAVSRCKPILVRD